MERLTTWEPMHYICDAEDLPIAVSRNVLELEEMNAACNATIIIERMLRNGRLPWRQRMMDALAARYRRYNAQRGKP